MMAAEEPPKEKRKKTTMTIFVKTEEGIKLTLKDIDTDARVSELHIKIEREYEIAVSQQRLTYESKGLRYSDRLSNFEIRDGSTLHLTLGPMRIFVEDLYGHCLTINDISPRTTIQEVKKLVREQTTLTSTSKYYCSLVRVVWNFTTIRLSTIAVSYAIPRSSPE